MANVGYLGGDVSIREKQALRDKYLKPIADRAIDHGLRDQCRCGQTKYVKWRRRWYCISCARFVRTLNGERDRAAKTTAPAADREGDRDG